MNWWTDNTDIDKIKQILNIIYLYHDLLVYCDLYYMSVWTVTDWHLTVTINIIVYYTVYSYTQITDITNCQTHNSKIWVPSTLQVISEYYDISIIL